MGDPLIAITGDVEGQDGSQLAALHLWKQGMDTAASGRIDRPCSVMCAA